MIPAGRVQYLRKPWLARAGCGFLALLLLGGCAPGGAMAAAQMVSGLVGGGQAETARPGTGIQNGRYQDESIRQALAAARREPLSACRARLPERQVLEPGRCGLSLVCLPGATSPTELYVCAPPEEAEPQAARRTLTSGSSLNRHGL